MNKQLLKKSITFGFYILLIIFLFFYLRSIDYDQLANLSINWWYVGLASLFGLSFRYWGVYIWLVLLRGLGAKNLTMNIQMIYIYAKSWMGRYIPGTAPWILGKIYFASQQGISKNKLAVSSLLEAALQIVVQIAFAFALLVFDTRLDVIDDTMKILMVAVLVGCVVAMIPGVFNKIVSVGYKLVRRKTLDTEHYANTKTIGKGAFLYAIGSVINGFSLFYIAKAIYPELGYENLPFVMGAGTLAGAVGMLAVFAPSGIGVREGVQLLLLSVIMPTEIALVVTVVTRLWGVGVDVLFYLLGKCFTLYKPKAREHL